MNVFRLAILLLAGTVIATAQPHGATLLRPVAKSKTLTIVPIPSLAMAPAPSTLTLCWDYEGRATFEVFATPHLAAPNWTCIARVPIAAELVITNLTTPAMFYRVEMSVQPPPVTDPISIIPTTNTITQ